MTKIQNNPLLKSASGMLGKTVYYRMWRGRLVMATCPVGGKPRSEMQVANQSRFSLAARWASSQMVFPEVQARYQAGVNYHLCSAHMVATKDFLNAPRVDAIFATDYKGAPGNPILIDATDDFMVTRVEVVILDGGGRVLEQGEAVKTEGVHQWLYTARVMNEFLHGTTIRATAYDRPGNETSKESVISIG